MDKKSPDLNHGIFTLGGNRSRGPSGVKVRHDLGLLGRSERLEVGQGAAKPELTRCTVHKINRNKPPWGIVLLCPAIRLGQKRVR